MISPRYRVLQTLNFQKPDRLPKDLGGMRSTGISAFAYPKLVAGLELPPRPPKVEDTMQMLALPDLDVLDALGCDVVTICDGVTNAFRQPEIWREYDFNGRLPALVRYPEKFVAKSDGTIFQSSLRMPPSSYVFDDLHGGQPLDFSADLPKFDLQQYKRQLEHRTPTDEQITELMNLCRRVRESSNRAVFFNDGWLQSPIGIGSFSGIGIFPMLCLTDSDWVAELHEIITAHYLKNIQAILPVISPYIDIIMMSADDWGTQNNLIASSQLYQKLFLPYLQRLNAECHRLAPEVKLFLHSCGAIFDLIDLVIEAEYDVLNPVQWTAGRHCYQEWKDKCRGRIALWGGGVDSQHTLPLGCLADITHQVGEVSRYLAQDGGYVFCNIHNILAEIPPEKIIAMYQAAVIDL